MKWVHPSADLFFLEFYKWEMKILVHVHFSFRLKIENNFTTHFSKFIFQINEISFFKFSKKMKFKI